MLDILKTQIIFFSSLIIIILIVTIYNKVTFSIYIKCYKKIRNGFITIKSYKDLTEISRDIDVQYSPAVLSYLIDQKVEINKDVTATLLNLYARRIIDIQKKGEKYIIKKGKNEENLSQDEQYIYDCFVENEKFRMETWVNVIRREYFKYGFNSENKKISLMPFYIICTSITAIIIYITLINAPQEYFEYWNTFTFAFISLNISICLNVAGGAFSHTPRKNSVENQIFLTDKGKREIKKWIKFKRFIKQYTLIEERTIEETQIYEKYIPYAMALRINKNYKDLEKIKKVDILKNIINTNIKNFQDEVWKIINEE